MNKDEHTYAEILNRIRETPERERSVGELVWTMVTFNASKYCDFFLRFFLAVVWESMIWMRWFLGLALVLWWYNWISLLSYVLTTIACSFTNSFLVFTMADMVRSPLRDRVLRYVVQ